MESSGFNQFHHDFSSLRRLSKTQVAKLTSRFLCASFVTQVCKISLHFQIKGIICPVTIYPSTNTTKLAAITIQLPNPKFSSFHLLFKEHPHQIPVHSHTIHTTRQSRQSQAFRKHPACLGRPQDSKIDALLTTKYFLAGEMVQLSWQEILASLISFFLMTTVKRLQVLTALANYQDPLHYMVNGPFNRKSNNIQLFVPTKTR